MKRIPFRLGGMALVVVLSFLALVTALVVAFVFGITSEVVATRQDDGFTRSRQLAELAVNSVMAQIKQSTARGKQGEINGVAWVSQPGMIRTYGTSDNKPSTAPLAYYKLYSSADMEVTAGEIASFNPANEVPSDWASLSAQFTDLNAPCVGGDGAWHYPIFDPAAASGSNAISGCHLSPSTPVGTSNPAPMPVRWIYVLRDGTLTSSTNGTTSLRWPSSGNTAYKSPSRANPIVGRIAFWTDDETCKVNINTASEGAYWDVPRANTPGEKALASNAPVRQEWQRYPGHPATSSLSTVFPRLTPDRIYALTPRVSAVNAGSVTADRDRLYASVDELNFDPTHTQINPNLSAEEIERARFCLTAHSRAPELNLLGQPRVACWPIATGTNSRTVYDKAVALCSTIGGKPFYFQREDPNKTTTDIGLSRNQDLYLYLQGLMVRPMPGYTEHFSQKYKSANDRNQLLMEIFDYIRTTNLQDANLPAADRYAPDGWVIPSRQTANGPMGFGRAFTLSGMAIGFICNADGKNTEGCNTKENPNIGSDANRLQPGEVMIQAALVPDFFCVTQGWGGVKADLRIEVSGLKQLTLENRALYTSDTATVDYTADPATVAEGSPEGGAIGWRYFAVGQLKPEQDFTVKFPLVSNSVRFTPTVETRPEVSKKMSFSGGTLTVKLGSRSSGAVYQTFTVIFPASPGLPLSTIVDKGTPSLEGTAPETSKEQWWTFSNFGPPIVTSFGTTYTAGRVGNAHLAPGTPGKRLAGAFFREEYDVVRGVSLLQSDLRLAAAKPTVTISGTLSNYGSDDRISCLLSSRSSASDLSNGSLDAARSYFGDLVPNPACRPYCLPGAVRPEATGDFDTGLASAMDGPYVNKPDEGDAGSGKSQPPYFDPASRTLSNAFCSPNRMTPSPGMFGSLPSCLITGTPWRTLLFRPQGRDFAGKTLGQHPATTSTSALPDHLFLDFFWMPVVEPYALSEPFSTAGKVNLNYQIMPFTYIERSTALRAVFKPEKLAVIPNSAIKDYKTGSEDLEIRREIDVNVYPDKPDSEIETLRQFTQKFAKGEMFKSASEICDLYIVPDGERLEEMADFWNRARLTGDNVRERIYTTLYQKLTTRSNTYTVHYRVQVLKQMPAGRQTAAQWATWDEAKDKVLSETRGAAIIERYVDPNQGLSTPGSTKDDLPDFARSDAADVNGNGISDRDEDLDDYYRFRVIGVRRFLP